MKIAILFALALTALAAQTIEVRHFAPLAPLDGDWKLSTGDDPRFAVPEFDDSAWRSVQVPGEEILIAQGPSWIRLHVLLPELPRDTLPAERLVLLLPPLGASYDVFVNGRQVGSFGNLRAANGWGYITPVAAAFAIPSGSRQVTIAIRNRSIIASPVPSATLRAWIGTAQAIAEKQRDVEVEVRWRSVGHLTMMSATAMAGLFFLLLPIWRRDAREYFWCGCFLLLAMLMRPVTVAPWMLEGVAVPLVLGGTLALGVLGIHCWERLFSLLLGVPLSTWGRRCQQGMLLWVIAVCVLILFRWNRMNPFLAPTILLLSALQLGVYLDLARRSPRGPEAPWMHTAVALYLGATIAYFVLYLRLVGGFLSHGIDLPDLALTVRGVGALLFAGVMAMVLNRRSARVQSEQERLAQEMRAGKEMQELLLPAGAIEAPGFAIEATYLPMSEVGGDFYFTRPEPGGGLLVVVGDVSGKGLKAAMLVSVTIGILRTEKSSSPAVILGTMNDGLAGHMGGGFVTACCARFDPDGRVTIASAGHPSPYADGQEVAIEAGLPLGIAAGTTYAESVTSDRCFTFVSDGVVEAENTQRELFGFDRTREISTKPAQEIAKAAKSWGQNDDITVVTVRRNG